MNPEFIISDAASVFHIVRILYQKSKTGEIKTYEVEPYEFKDGYFWGYDVFANSIKKFILNNILSAEDTEIEFSPRWSVQIY